MIVARAASSSNAADFKAISSKNVTSTYLKAGIGYRVKPKAATLSTFNGRIGMSCLILLLS